MAIMPQQLSIQAKNLSENSSDDQPCHSYDHDFYAWTQEQSQLLRSGQLQSIDLEHLKALIPEVFDDLYQLAIITATRETGLYLFPEICPYRLEQVLSDEFLPD